MQTEPRLLAEKAWDGFVHGGLEPVGLKDEIVRSWLRARDAYGIDPTAARPRSRMDAAAAEERRRIDEVYPFARPILAEFSDRLSLADHVLACFDADGWMLDLTGDGRVAAALEEIGFAPGSNWSEPSAGTNGPGTALATARPVEVFSAEHFVEAWQPWSCAAAPILAPGTGRPAGAIDLTGPWQVRRRHSLLVAKLIARAVEERLRAVYGVRREVIEHALRTAQEHGDALVAVDLGGRVLAANDAAVRRGVVLAGGELTAEIRALLGGPAGLPASGVTPLGPSLLLAPVRYEGTPIGAILRSPMPRATSRRCAAAPAARHQRASIIGESPALLAAIELAMRAAENELTVVLCGESGVGKELFAGAIHAASARRGGPFVAVNCGAIAPELVEAELLGYEPGSFTGATRDGKAGRLEDADRGTLFLDEVSELPPRAQTALLRALEERQVVRVGGGAPRDVDVRVVAATNRPLLAEVRKGRFRDDLYYRLNVMTIVIPPLRARGDDVALLARHFLAEAEALLGRGPLRLAPEAIARLAGYPWPGNARELRNVILRAAATARGGELGLADLVLDEELAPAVAAPRPRAAPPTRDALLAALEAHAWNLAAAARQLGASRMALYRWMQRHGVARARGTRGRSAPRRATP